MKTQLVILLVSLSFTSSMLADSDPSMKVLGESQIKFGLSSLESGDYRKALEFLRLGVVNSPQNLEARKVLAEIYEVALKRPNEAGALMIEGVHFGGIRDLDYTRETLRLLLRYEMDAEVLELAETYLPPTPEDSDIHESLAFGAANASFLGGNYDQSNKYLNDYDLLNSKEGILLSAQISWDSGNQLQAIYKLEDSLSEFPASEILMQLCSYHREIGNIEEAKRYVILLIASAPLNHRARIERLYILHKSNDLEEAEVAIEEVIDQFQEIEAAMKALAGFAVDTGNIELGKTVYGIALSQNFRMETFALLLIESCFLNKDYRSAQGFVDMIFKENPEWLSNCWGIFSSLRAVISTATDGTGKSDPAYLRDFLSDPDIYAKTYLAVAKRFAEVDGSIEVFKVLSIANEKYPQNQKVTTAFVRSCLEQNRLDEGIPSLKRLLTMRRPEKELLSEVLLKLKSKSIRRVDSEALIQQIETILQSHVSQ